MSQELLKISLIIVCVALLQLAMLAFTKTKRWSNHTFIRNCLIALCIAYTNQYGFKIWLIPIAVELLIETLNFNGIFYLDKRTLEFDYIYSDFFEAFVQLDKPTRYYTEGDFSNVVPNFPDTTDLQLSNISKIAKLGQHELQESYSEEMLNEIMDKSQVKKYDWMINSLGLTTHCKVLEIGFGKGDLLRYLKLKGISASGISVAIEQVKLMKQQGFEVHHIDFWDIPKNPQLLQRFDAVIMNGCTEYLVPSGEPRNKYIAMFDLIKSLFIPSSELKKVLITCIHHKFTLRAQPTLYGKIMQYFLISGNGMVFSPIGQDGLTQYASQVGFSTLKKENRVLDYYIYSRITSCLYWRDRARITYKFLTVTIPLLITYPHFFHTVYAYTGCGIFNSPWNWQFTPQEKGYIPTDHYWLILQST